MTERGRVEVHADASALAREAAEAFVARAGDAVERQGRFAVALTGGGSPRELYGLLGEPGLAGRVPWESVHLFWGDERAMPPAHPRSNYGMAQERFISRVPIPRANVHRIVGEMGARAAADRYERELRGFFGERARFDLIYLGLGADGHVASLFPFDLPRLQERERWAEPALLREFGEWRVTLTPPVLRDAARVEFLVPDEARASIAATVLLGPLDPFRIPAQLVRPTRGDLVWRITTAVARRLPPSGEPSA